MAVEMLGTPAVSFAPMEAACAHIHSHAVLTPNRLVVRRAAEGRGGVTKCCARAGQPASAARTHRAPVELLQEPPRPHVRARVISELWSRDGIRVERRN